MPVEISQAGALTRLPRVNCSAFWLRGETRSCLEFAHIQQFRVYHRDQSAAFAEPADPWGRARPGGLPLAKPRAIVVLVDRGGAMIATRPDRGIFAPRERIQTQSPS